MLMKKHLAPTVTKRADGLVSQGLLLALAVGYVRPRPLELIHSTHPEIACVAEEVHAAAAEEAESRKQEFIISSQAPGPTGNPPVTLSMPGPACYP